MDFLYIKALHIIFVVCWFAALFYIVRLFIYATEAQQKEEPAKTILTEQLLLMQKNYGILSAGRP
ncbi:MAG: CopD family protein [Bacteroidia bacterium]